MISCTAAVETIARLRGSSESVGGWPIMKEAAEVLESLQREVETLRAQAANIRQDALRDAVDHFVLRNRVMFTIDEIAHELRALQHTEEVLSQEGKADNSTIDETPTGTPLTQAQTLFNHITLEFRDTVKLESIILAKEQELADAIHDIERLTATNSELATELAALQSVSAPQSGKKEEAS